jgi:sialate O-acetylesterase
MNHHRLLNSILLVAVCAACVCQTAAAQLKLGAVFGDNMVLQRDMELKIWGSATPDSDVSVQLKDQSLSAKADSSGKWMVTGKPISIGAPFAVMISSGNEKLTLKNCVAGDVWICSGQSNMEWRLRDTNDAEATIKAANLPMIRHFKVDNSTALNERDTLTGTGWKVCSPETAADFTAVGFHFGKSLNSKLEVPIGLLNTTWGGTMVEAWTSGDALSTLPDFANRVQDVRDSDKDEAKAAAQAEAFQSWQAKIHKALNDESEQWQADSVDDSTWKQAAVPGFWEAQGFEGYDGTFWYRKSIEIPEGWTGKELTLNLGPIDDGDKTYVNGTLVGQTNAWNAERIYSVAAASVKTNKLTVAVRVTDGMLGGGMYGKPFVTLKDDTGDRIDLSGQWQIKPTSLTADAGPKPATAFAGPHHPTVLYNAMVKPLVPLSFRGVIWYQGESNAGRAYQYRTLFPLLIEDWRSQWNREFPFYWVQLANFQAAATEPGPSSWAELREAQSMTLALPKTGQAVIIDVGEADDIHPRDKATVGNRLAAIAMANNYDRNEEYSGPVYKSMSVQGNVVTLTFDHAESLEARGGPLKRFELAGKDQTFHFAEAKCVGDNKVEVSCDEVPNPVAVRYAWADNPEGCNLYNSAGFPASPFRSDSWKGITGGQ